MTARCLAAGLAMLLPLAPLAVAGGPINYMPTPVSGKYEAAIALNNAGLVAINNRDTNVPSRTGYIATFPTPTDVGTLGGSDSFIRAINDSNQAVGESTTADGATHAFLFAGGHMQDLTAAYGIASAASLNNRGDVAGTSTQGQAVVLRNGKIVAFGPPGSGAASINDVGDVAGEYVANGLPDGAFLYSQGRFASLGTPGGYSAVAAVNNDGAVAGTRYGPGGRGHAFLYENGRMTDLTPAAGNSTAVDINDAGQVVGTADGEPFLYADGQLVDPNTLLAPDAYWRMETPIAINNAGQILSTGCDSQNFCYVISRFDPVPAVPEVPPAVMLLAGLATLGAGFARRRS